MSSKPALFDEDAPKFESSVHRVKLSCSSSKDSGNKENMSMNKEEAPMMSMEPIPMKRKKKGGAYNLRKSLAWDRAFLTEEGILDPMELSVISGTCSNNVGQALTAIAEIGSYFKRADSRNMRKEALQKMSTVHCVSGSGTKSSGCPRPSPTSSLERPAFGNTSRSSSKELKFFKTTIPKPSMCSIPRSAKGSVSAGSQLQQNQFVQSAANKQTCPGSSKISPIKSTPQVKDGSAVSPSTSSSKLIKGNSATTSLRLHPSTKIHQPPVSKVSNTCLKKNPREVDALGVSLNKGNGSVDIAHIPQRTTAGKSMHHAQFQAKKPSGLRMPSPSLGFFAQPKVSIPSQPTLTSFKPNIPGLCYVRDHRKGKILHDTKSSLSTMPLSSTEKLASSDSDGVPCETSKPVLQQNTNKFVHAEISNDEEPMRGVDAIDKVDKVLGQHETSVRIIFKEASEQEINDTGFLPQPEDDDMEKSIQGFQACRRNDSDSTCSLSTFQKISALSWQHEGEIISNSSVTSSTLTCELPLAADHVVPDKKSLAEDHQELPMNSCYQSLEHNMNKSEHDEISYDELPMHRVDAVDKSDKVYAQHETTKRNIFRAVSEHKINDLGLVPQPEDGDMEMRIQGFQACRSNSNDSTYSLLTSQKFSALSGQHEGEIICDSVVTSLSFTSELPCATEDIIPNKKSSTENQRELPMEICFQSLEQNMDKSENTEISYDELAMHGADAVGKSDKVHAQHETSEMITFKAVSEHKVNDTELLPQQKDGVMEKSIQGFQVCKRNDSDSTCSMSTCQKVSALFRKHKGEIICNSSVTSLSFTCELPLAADDVVPDKKSLAEDHLELPMEICYRSLEHNMNKSEHDEISYDELPMHGVDAVDKSIKVYAQHETSKRISFRAVDEHKINDIGLLPQLEDGDMEMSIQGFQACRSNPNDSTCSLLTSQKLSALSRQHEGEIVCDSVVTSVSFTSELPFAAEDIVSDKTTSIENLHELPTGSCYQSLEQNMNKSEHTAISYDELAMCGADSVDKSNKVHPQHETSERFTFKAVSEHKIHDTELLPQQEDDVMEKSIQGFQSCRNNDSDKTCCLSMCQKLSALSGQHEGESICNSAVTSVNFTCEFPIETEDIVPDKKSTTENHQELPIESCYQSLEQSDDVIFSAPEVPESKNNNSVSEVPEDNTCKDVEVLAISGELKCQAPESCDSELESSCVLCSGKCKTYSTDAGSRTKVDEETYVGGVQLYALKGMDPKNHLNVKAVTADMECSEKHWEAERIHIAVEGSSHCNRELGVTGDLLPQREPVQKKVAEVLPSCTVPNESDKKCENTSCIEKISLQGAMARENSPSSQYKLDRLESNRLEDEDNAEILFKVDTFDGEELTHNSGSISIEKIKNSEKNSNKIEHLILPKDLAPFSDAWLAAIEAAGEDVLTRKTGAVQNSPTDKSLPEPGPWSPVKRKSNGPFDCTKYTNLVASESPQ